MSVPFNGVIDFENRNRITNLAASVANGQPVVHEQLTAAIEGISWKDAVRVMSVANVTIASPGANIDGIAMVAGDRVGLKDQTSNLENGIYIWNGAATPMTRALDASTFTELEGGRVTVEEGTNVGSDWRQTQVNGVIGTNAILFTSAGSSAPAASETVAGVAEIATQAEANTGTDDLRFITPLKAKNATWMVKKVAATFGDGSATSIAITHNLGTTDVQAQVWETGGTLREVLCEKRATSTNVTTFLFDVAPPLNSLRYVIMG